ncbi:uroporphyrinogen-III synthase [Aeromicrobium sp. CTD01-1L150]|uniref:uroporphyrinogen-III synthase n=1 Tax=Aeromicrobium sp. CTD01-1L150 TaxID=3341830 RepID=UPI0035BEE2A1
MTTLSKVLAGTSILVTAQRRAEELSNALERRGAEVTVAAALGVQSHIDEAGLLDVTRRLVAAPPDVLVVTTGIGFRGWLDTAEAFDLAAPLLEALRRTRIVARGPKARGALQAAGLTPDWVAESETSAEIIELLLAEGVEGQHLAVQHHGAGDDGIEHALRSAGATTSTIVVYRWGPPPDPESLDRSVTDAAAGGFDAIVFTSAPGASSWLKVVAEQGYLESLRDLEGAGRLVLAAVGPVTADPLVSSGFEPLVPERSRLGALVRELIVQLGEESTTIRVPAGALRIRAGVATLDHQLLGVSPSGVAVLRALAASPGAVVSREDLLEVLPGASQDPHTAEMAVARLREAVGRSTIRTVVKRGYRLDVQENP